MDQLFTFFSLLITVSTIMIIISMNPIHSVFWLVLVFINSAGLLITMGFEFIGLMLIIIYVGAITILFLFVIMMLDVFQLKKSYKLNHLLPIITVSIINIVTQFSYVINNNIKFYNNSNMIWWDFNISNHIMNLGLIFYTDYAYPFIVLSLLLLVAMIGAIVLTLESGLITKRQNLTKQHQRNNSWI